MEMIILIGKKSNDMNHFGDKYLWATPGDIKSNRYIMKTDRMLSEKGFNAIRKINKNSVMATCIGSTIGKLAMASETMATNQQINALECNDKNNPEFIYYNLIYNNNLFHKYSSTQAVPLINKSTFSNIEIKIAYLQEQEKIANLLSSIDNKIELEEEKLEKYEKLKKGLMQRMFI